MNYRSSILAAISLVVVILSVTACGSHAKTDELRTLVEQWQGREIKLPEVMTDVLTGDTIDFSDADFTILTYVDSAGCTSCKLRLPIWNEFANSLDSISDATVKLLIVVNPKVNKEITYFLKRDSYPHPVYMDEGDRVNTVNKFLNEPSAQSFLLDRYNKVIAIGNPTVNNSIAAFYKSIISGKKSMSIYNDAVVDVEHQNINLGKLPVRNGKTECFRLINNSNDTIFIRRIEASCHCTEAFVGTKILLPRSCVEGTVKFLGDTIKGEFNNTNHIFFEGFDYPSIVNVYGDIQ